MVIMSPVYFKTYRASNKITTADGGQLFHSTKVSVPKRILQAWIGDSTAGLRFGDVIIHLFSPSVYGGLLRTGAATRPSVRTFRLSPAHPK